MENELIVKDNTKIAVIGAGPAGSFFAISLLIECRSRNIRPTVYLFDSKDFRQKGPRGCNMCAGVLGRAITSRLDGLNFDLRPVIQRIIQGYHLHTPAGTILLDLNDDQFDSLIYTVYRGSGPFSNDTVRPIKSFDQFLVERAISEGAKFIEKKVCSVILPRKSDEKIILKWDEHEDSFDCVVGAYGVNSNLLEHFKRLDFGYIPPKLWQTCQAEIRMDKEFITQALMDQIHIFALGTGKVKYLSFTPKSNYLTATAVGDNIKKTDLIKILEHPQIREFLKSNFEIPCHCHPRLPVSSASKPFTDRLVVIGDASYSRFLKNGIESAFITSSLAVKTLLSSGFSEEALGKVYFKECRRFFEYDNLFGKLILGGADILWKMPLLDKIHLVAAREELYENSRALTSIMWDISTGESPYRDIFRRYHSFKIYRKLFNQLWKTLFKGISADAHGR